MLTILLGCANPRDSSAIHVHVSLAMAYLQQGDLEKAREILNSILTNHSQDSLVWGAKAYLEEQAGNTILAESAYRRAIFINPSNGENHNNYGVFLCRNHKPQEGLREILTAIHLPSYVYLATAYENAALCAKKIPDLHAARIYHQAARHNAGRGESRL